MAEVPLTISSIVVSLYKSIGQLYLGIFTYSTGWSNKHRTVILRHLYLQYRVSNKHRTVILRHLYLQYRVV